METEARDAMALAQGWRHTMFGVVEACDGKDGLKKGQERQKEKKNAGR